jgi:uncharacterized metal-binding protein
MSEERKTVAVVPCSGIGKALGSVSREAAYVLCDELRPADTRLVALSKLVLGEPEARGRVCAGPVITIDGCKLGCAAALVRHSGGEPARAVAVLDVFRRHPDLRPEGIAELNEGGLALARALAEELVPEVEAMTRPGADGGEGHG